MIARHTAIISSYSSSTESRLDNGTNQHQADRLPITSQILITVHSLTTDKRSGATFSKLLRKIFGRLLFLRKNAHSRNFFGNFFGRI